MKLVGFSFVCSGILGILWAHMGLLGILWVFRDLMGLRDCGTKASGPPKRNNPKQQKNNQKTNLKKRGNASRKLLNVSWESLTRRLNLTPCPTICEESSRSTQSPARQASVRTNEMCRVWHHFLRPLGQEMAHSAMQGGQQHKSPRLPE